jgi:hypothetical protein
MIGGSPILQGGYYSDPNPALSYPSLPAQQRAVAGSTMVRTTLPAVNPAKVRMQNGEEGMPALSAVNVAALEMPAPDQFGLGARYRRGDVDWSAVRNRLSALAITSFHLQRLPDGFRFTCLVPSGTDRPRKIESEGDTDAEAIDRALCQAEQMSQTRR